jgi:hypothetical protein
MSDNRVKEIVRGAVAQSLERQLASLRESVVQDVLREISPSLGERASGSSTAALKKAVAAIQAGSTQKEILRALLDNTVLYGGRAALFVVKNGSATGWQGIAFSNNDAIKDFPIDITSGLAAQAIQSHESECGAASQFDRRFVATFGAPGDDRAVVLPLLLRDKVSALVYADAGSGSMLDEAALDVLVRATSAWLEVISQRRQAQKEGAEASEPSPAAPSNDPFAAHAPIHAAKAQLESQAAPAAMAAAAAWGGGGPRTAVPSEETDADRKAQRFARLLIDEIKLYNHAKVNEGRKHKDLYDRLKDDIEKSRATYQKRYGNTPAGSADYFNQELISSLAEDDISLLGGNFRR